MRIPFPVYFCRKVPVEQLNLRRNVSINVDQPWFEALCKDIEKNGLASPLLVLHYANETLIRAVPMSVKVGQNRLRALRKLGWKHVPCIIVGRVGDPPPAGLDVVLLKNLSEVQALLADGVARFAKYESLSIDNVTAPERMIYPEPKEPYFDVE